MTDMRRAFHIDGDLVEIKSEQHPQMRMDMVRIGMGTADVRFRPEFRDWSADVPIRFNEAVISVEQIVNLFNLAGFGVGIGEWRPEKDGQWGMFHVGGRVEVERDERKGAMKRPAETMYARSGSRTAHSMRPETRPG